MFADCDRQSGSGKRPAPSSPIALVDPVQPEGQRQQHARPQLVQHEKVPVEAKRGADQQQREADTAQARRSRFLSKPAPPCQQHGGQQCQRGGNLAGNAQPGIDIGERGQAHGDAGPHRIVSKAVLGDDEIVVVFVVLDVFDGVVVKCKVFVVFMRWRSLRDGE